jgi:cbb3-type cytochrome oxidase subunit 3
MSRRLDEPIFVPPGATGVLRPRGEGTEVAYLRVVAEALNFYREHGQDMPIEEVDAKRDLALVRKDSVVGYESNASRTVTTIRFDAPGGHRQLFAVESRFGATPYRSLLLMHEGVVVDLLEYSQAANGSPVVANAIKQLDSQVRKLQHPEQVGISVVFALFGILCLALGVLGAVMAGLALLFHVDVETVFLAIVALMTIGLLGAAIWAYRTRAKKEREQQPELPRPI